jgi:23S rRNA (cytosine1962-C5)-methyltransferase
MKANKIDQIPNPSSSRIAFRIKTSAEKEIRNGHPWLFDRSIKYQSHHGKPGDLGVIFDNKRNFLAIGLYDPVSPIRLRILQKRDSRQINSDFFQSRLVSAFRIRKAIPENTTGYRLVHGENDFLPGLVIDRYDKTLVLKIYTLSWIPYLKILLPLLFLLDPFTTIVLRMGRKIQSFHHFLYGLKDGEIIFGNPVEKDFKFLENGLTFLVDPLKGHKTGFYLDQRENRKRVEKLSFGKTVLNLFAYTGGFSLYAARGGASSVISADLSQLALTISEKNFNLLKEIEPGNTCFHETLSGDAFEILQNFGMQKMNFDMVIIDPPSFANKKSQISTGLASYTRLTKLALKVLRPGGTLVQSSCSSRISNDSFFQAIHQKAHEIGRSLNEIQRTGHPVDHPITFKEGAYLKTLFARG